MSRMKAFLLAATLLAGGAGGMAYAQQAPGQQATGQQATQPTYDPAQLPQVQGKVAQYSLTPRGDVDGLILEDGTQVHFPPHMSTALVYAVRPGDAVTIYGLKAKALPMVMAMSITNDATHQTVTEAGPHGPRMDEGAPGTEITGQVKTPLYGPRGEINGVLLADGTEVRLPPPDATRLGDALAAGKTVVVRGQAIDGPLGKLMLARAIGPDANTLTPIKAPRPGEHGPGHGKHGHGPHGGGGPDAPGRRPAAAPGAVTHGRGVTQPPATPCVLT